MYLPNNKIFIFNINIIYFLKSVIKILFLDKIHDQKLNLVRTWIPWQFQEVLLLLYITTSMNGKGSYDRWIADQKDQLIDDLPAL